MSMNFVKPSANTITGVTVFQPTRAYDNAGTPGDTTTSAEITADQPASVGAVTTTLVVSGFPALPVQTYSSKILRIKHAVSFIDDFGGNSPFASLSYSLNGGSSYTTIATVSSVTGILSYDVPISAAQDPTLVKVKATSFASSDSSASATITSNLYDVWLEGIYGVAGSGKKASAAIGC